MKKGGSEYMLVSGEHGDGEHEILEMGPEISMMIYCGLKSPPVVYLVVHSCDIFSHTHSHTLLPIPSAFHSTNLAYCVWLCSSRNVQGEIMTEKTKKM